MPKIYTAPKNLIHAIMKVLRIGHGFTTKDTEWEPIKVDEQLVVFETSARIKELVKKELFPEIKKLITFEENKNSTWNIIVADDGTESFLFARILFIALARLNSGIVDIKIRNFEIIEYYVAKSVMREKISTLGFSTRVEYIKGKYQVTFPVNGMITTFADKNVDALCRGIDQKLRGFFKPVF